MIIIVRKERILEIIDIIIGIVVLRITIIMAINIAINSSMLRSNSYAIVTFI